MTQRPLYTQPGRNANCVSNPQQFCTPNLPSRAESSKEFKFKLVAPVSALVLWTMLWCNLNTGFWNIKPPSDFNDWLLSRFADSCRSWYSRSWFFTANPQKANLEMVRAVTPSYGVWLYSRTGIRSLIRNRYGRFTGRFCLLATMFAAWNFLDCTDLLGACETNAPGDLGGDVCRGSYHRVSGPGIHIWTRAFRLCGCFRAEQYVLLKVWA